MSTLTATKQGSGGAATGGRPTPAWRERLKVPGAILAGLMVVALGWQLLGRGGDEQVVAPSTTAYADRGLGLRLGHPPAWQVVRRGPSRRIVSPDRAITIVLASPTVGNFTREVRRDTERALLAAYRPARVVGRVPGRLGTRRVTSTEMVATQQTGKPVRILSMAATSRWRTYSVAVFSAIPPRAARLLEAQQILRSVAFVRPAPRR